MASANEITAESWQPLCDELQKALVERLAAQDHNATGALSDSIEVIAKKEAQKWCIEVWAKHYGRWVNNGRDSVARNPKVKMPPIDVIREWMDVRNIGNDLAKEYQKRGLAFVIARSIKEKGIPPEGGYSDHYAKGNTIERTGWVDRVIEEKEEYIADYVAEIAGEVADWIIFNKYRNTIKFLNNGSN